MNVEKQEAPDTREYLREIVRSNGTLGSFWRRHDQLGAEVRSPTAGVVMIEVNPLAFGGKGCISAIENPIHIGPPFGWSPITFAEWARRIRSGPSDKIRIFGRRLAYELRFFTLPWQDAPPRKTFDRSLLAMGLEAPMAAFEVSRKTREFLESLMVDGQGTLAKSLRARMEAKNSTFGLDMITLYDLLGELAIFKGLFGSLVQRDMLQVLAGLIDRIKSEVEALDALVEKHQLDMVMTNLTSRMLDAYIISLDHLYSKSGVFTNLATGHMKGYVRQVYYQLQELRTVSENVCAASSLLGHPRDIYRWIAEFRSYDYALREILDKTYHADWDSYAITEDRRLFFRDRFAYPPEISWWMWFPLEKMTDQTLGSLLAFDSEDVRRKTGLKTVTKEELPTPVPAVKLVGRDVELMVIRSDNFPELAGLYIPALRVDRVLATGPSEGAYFSSKPMEESEPIVIKVEEKPYRVATVRFGNSLPRSAPQSVTDAATSALMRSDPYRRIVVEASIDVELMQLGASVPATGQSAAPPTEEGKDAGSLPLAYALLASYMPGQPSAFEIQEFRLHEKYLREMKAEREARDIDYAR